MKLIQKTGNDTTEAMVYRAATNRALNFLRDRKNRARLLSENAGAATPGGASVQGTGAENATLARDLLRRLPKREAEVAFYVLVEGLTQAETADVMGCDQRTVGRALQSLQQRHGAVPAARTTTSTYPARVPGRIKNVFKNVIRNAIMKPPTENNVPPTAAPQAEADALALWTCEEMSARDVATAALKAACGEGPETPGVRVRLACSCFRKNWPNTGCRCGCPQPCLSLTGRPNLRLRLGGVARSCGRPCPQPPPWRWCWSLGFDRGRRTPPTRALARLARSKPPLPLTTQHEPRAPRRPHWIRP